MALAARTRQVIGSVFADANAAKEFCDAVDTSGVTLSARTVRVLANVLSSRYAAAQIQGFVFVGLGITTAPYLRRMLANAFPEPTVVADIWSNLSS